MTLSEAAVGTVSTSATVAWLSDNWMGMAATVVAVLTFAVTFYYKRREDKRAERRLQHDMNKRS